MTPTERTLKWLREKQGLRVEKHHCVERWIARPDLPGGGFRADYAGILDYIVPDVARGVHVGVQSCGEAFSEHRKKILGEGSGAARDFLACSGEVWLVGWRKVKKKRGGKAMEWKPRVEEFAVVDGSLVALESNRGE